MKTLTPEDLGTTFMYTEHLESASKFECQYCTHEEKKIVYWNTQYIKKNFFKIFISRCAYARAYA